MKTIFKIIGKVVLYLLATLLIVLMLATIFLWIKSPGKPQPITDSSGVTIPGSISSIEKITLGGVEQYIIVRGEDSTKPVMLFLHGGPGSQFWTWLWTHPLAGGIVAVVVALLLWKQPRQTMKLGLAIMVLEVHQSVLLSFQRL